MVMVFWENQLIIIDDYQLFLLLLVKQIE